MKLRRIVAGVAACGAILSLAMLHRSDVANAGAGYLTATLPVIGGSSYCGSYVTGSTGQICAQTIPAGPNAMTGLELFPVDTQLGSGNMPTTAAVPGGLLGNAINRLIGGDADTNLNQRSSTTKGIAALAGVTMTSATMTADRWWVISPGGTSNVTYTVDSTAATATIAGVNNAKAFRVARTTSATGKLTCFGQTLDKAAAAPLIGNNAVFSFWESNGATQSATNGNIVVNIDYTSAADGVGTQATLGYAGLNGSLFAKLDVGGTTTGLTNGTQAVSGFSPGTTGVLTAGLTNGFSGTIAASTTWTRYGVYAYIPVNIPGTTTPVTEVSVSVCYTPTAATAVTTDYIELEQLQLEMQPATATANLPSGVTAPRGYTRRIAADEQTYQYSYLYFNYEQQSLGLTLNGACENTSTAVANCNVIFPVPMRIVPALQFTAGFQVFAQVGETSLNVCASNGLSASLASFASNTGFLMNCTATVGAAGTANQWMSLGTGSSAGVISASAEP